MTKLRQFAWFWYDFIVGDDWTIAVAVLVAVSATVIVVRLDEPAWFLVPLAVIGVLGSSLRHAARARQSPPTR